MFPLLQMLNGFYRNGEERKKASQQNIELLLKGGEKHASSIQKRPLAAHSDDISGQKIQKEKGQARSTFALHTGRASLRH